MLSTETFEKIVEGNDQKDPFRANYEYAYDAYEIAFEEIWANYKKNFFSKFKIPFEVFKKENAYWLDNDALYEAFCLENVCDYWPQWENELDKNIFKTKTPDNFSQFFADRIVEKLKSNSITDFDLVTCTPSGKLLLKKKALITLEFWVNV